MAVAAARSAGPAAMSLAETLGSAEQKSTNSDVESPAAPGPAIRSSDGRGALILAGYFAIVIGFGLAAASTPGFYESQFCDRVTNQAACAGHSPWASTDPGGALLPLYVFYGGLLLVGLWGLALRCSRAFRCWAWRARPSLPCSGGVGNAGQAVLVVALLLLHVGWAWWWKDHLGGGCEGCSVAARISKTIGHLNDLDMSLLLLLASRTNVWESVLGLGYDAGVAWHRALGTLMVAWVTLHVLIWHISWAFEGVWLEHAITYSDDPNVLLTNPNISCSFAQTIAATCGNGHFWAIPSLELFSLTLWGPAMFLALSTKTRRATYERFHMWHHVFLGFIPLSYYHSWHVWQYSYIGVALWIFNKLLAWKQSMVQVTVQPDSRALECGVSYLKLSTAVVPSCGGVKHHVAGQFMYLCIPEIDPWQ